MQYTHQHLEKDLEGVQYSENAIYHPEVGDLTLEVMAELAALEKAERIEASVARLQIAKDNREIGPRRHMEFGVVVAEIDVQDYDDQERLEPGYWTDPNSVKEFVKLIPESRVVSKPDRLTIRHPGFSKPLA